MFNKLCRQENRNNEGKSTGIVLVHGPGGRHSQIREITQVRLLKLKRSSLTRNQSNYNAKLVFSRTEPILKSQQRIFAERECSLFLTVVVFLE